MILERIVNIQPYISSYYEATKLVLESRQRDKQAGITETETEAETESERGIESESWAFGLDDDAKLKLKTSVC